VLNITSENNRRAKTGVQVYDEYIGRAQQIQSSKTGLIGRPLFGIHELDQILGGVRGNDLIVVAARPKMGKTALVMSAVANMVLWNDPFALMSGEISNVDAMSRLLASYTNVDSYRLDRGEFFVHSSIANTMDAYKELLTLIGDKAIFDNPELSIPYAMSKVQSLRDVLGIKTFFIDRVGLFSEVMSNPNNDHAMRNQVTAKLRLLSNRGNSIFVASQLSADVEKTATKRPELRHVFGGTGVQANATRVLLVYRPEVYGFSEFPSGQFEGQDCIGYAEIIVAANTFGETGSIKVRFDKTSQIFIQ
jgi:replicative DNA helicase